MDPTVYFLNLDKLNFYISIITGAHTVTNEYWCVNLSMQSMKINILDYKGSSKKF